MSGQILSSDPNSESLLDNLEGVKGPTTAADNQISVDHSRCSSVSFSEPIMQPPPPGPAATLEEHLHAVDAASSPEDNFDDPLVIAQSLTYVTDDNSVVATYRSAPFSLAFKLRFVAVEVAFVSIVFLCIPVAAHGTVVSMTIFNCLLIAWFWYNHVRAADVKTDGVRVFMGNFEFDVPFDRIESISHMTDHPCNFCGAPHGFSAQRGLYTDPMDGVCIRTGLAYTPLWAWPRAMGRPERQCCCGLWEFPRMTLIFSPAGGSVNFIRDVEREMRNYANATAPKPPGAPGNADAALKDDDDVHFVEQMANGDGSGLSHRSGRNEQQPGQQPFSGDLFDV